MKPRQRRLLFVAVAVAGVALAAVMVTRALQSNLTYYYTPTQVASHEAPQGRLFRVGGLVKKGSLTRKENVGVEFTVTDLHTDLVIHYQGILPDLFKEEGGAVVRGRLDESGRFVAEEVMAKHDASYVPPEVAATLKQTAPGATQP